MNSFRVVTAVFSTPEWNVGLKFCMGWWNHIFSTKSVFTSSGLFGFPVGPLGMLPISRGDQSRCCIWMTSEPFTNIPYFLIQNLRIITWDNFTPHIIEEGEPEGEVESSTAPSLENTLKTGECAIKFTLIRYCSSFQEITVLLSFVCCSLNFYWQDWY